MPGLSIPKYEPQVRPQEGQAPSVPNLTAPPPVAFGTEIANKVQQTGQEISQIGTQLGEHMIMQQKAIQEAQVIAADKQYRDQLQAKMFDPTIDPKTNKAIGVFNRFGTDATGATQELDQAQATLRQKNIDGMGSPYQKQLLGEKIDENYGRLRELIAHHEATQVHDGLNQISQDLLNTQISNAANWSQVPDGLIKEINSGHSEIVRNNIQNGSGRKGTFADMENFTYKMADSAIKPLITADPSQALNYLDKVNSGKDENGHPVMSPNIYNKLHDEIIEKARTLDGLNKYAKKQKDVSQFNDWNTTEAQLSGKFSNGQLKQDDVEEMKGKVSDSFYKSVTSALKNYGEPPQGTPEQQNSAAITLQKQWISILKSPPDEQSKKMIQFRSDVLASGPKISQDSFNKLLSWTDPNFVKNLTPEKIGHFEAAYEYAKKHYDDFLPGSGKSAEAIFGAIKAGMNPNTSPDDIPAAVRSAVKGDTLAAHPSLVGQEHLTNNTMNQASGIQQVNRDSTQGKSDLKLNSKPSKNDRVDVADEKEAQKLPVGTMFRLKDGRTGTVKA